jgi:DNA-binding LytR/AlgR family response regulator
VKAVERENGRLVVSLGDGTRIAVSRTYLAQVREQFELGVG